MQINIIVKKFGKIKEAKINISNYSIFIGSNNSGKTLLLQLIYGIINKIQVAKFGNVHVRNAINKGTVIDKSAILEMQEEINVYLEEKKEEIVREIFHSTINIGKLELEFINIHERYEIRKWDLESAHEENVVNEDLLADLISKRSTIISIKKINITNEKVMDEKHMQVPNRDDVVSKMLTEHYVNRQLKRYLLDINSEDTGESIFLPASRTGLLLLYKRFFSENDKKNKDKRDIESIINRENRQNINEYGLSEPVYDFLQFLLTYTPSKELSKDREEIVEFIESKLIDGHLLEADNNTYYNPNGTNINMPLYLSSSMVNELTPILKIVTDVKRFNYIFYDEVETCLHPMKQGEMARLLNRLNNNGIKLLVTTHSDTMASKINNLFLLSSGIIPNSREQKVLSELGISKDDLLNCPNFHVYQFNNNNDGSSSVTELKFSKSQGMGYDFSLFDENALKLFNETKVIMGIE